MSDAFRLCNCAFYRPEDSQVGEIECSLRLALGLLPNAPVIYVRIRGPRYSAALHRYHGMTALTTSEVNTSLF